MTYYEFRQNLEKFKTDVIHGTLLSIDAEFNGEEFHSQIVSIIEERYDVDDICEIEDDELSEELYSHVEDLEDDLLSGRSNEISLIEYIFINGYCFFTIKQRIEELKQQFECLNGDTTLFRNEFFELYNFFETLLINQNDLRQLLDLDYINSYYITKYDNCDTYSVELSITINIVENIFNRLMWFLERAKNSEKLK